MTLVEDGEADFIQDHKDRCRDHSKEIYGGRERLGSTLTIALEGGRL